MIDVSRSKMGLVGYLLVAAACSGNTRSIDNRLRDSVAVGRIGPNGGVIEVVQLVRIAFPRGFWATPETVTVRVSTSPTTTPAVVYQHRGAGRGPYLWFDVQVRADSLPQADYVLTLTLPVDSLCEAAHGLVPTAFREVSGGSELELHTAYEQLPSWLTPDGKSLRARVPKHDGSRLGPLNDTIVVGCAPAEPEQLPGESSDSVPNTSTHGMMTGLPLLLHASLPTPSPSPGMIQRWLWCGSCT